MVRVAWSGFYFHGSLVKVLWSQYHGQGYIYPSVIVRVITGKTHCAGVRVGAGGRSDHPSETKEVIVIGWVAGSPGVQESPGTEGRPGGVPGVGEAGQGGAQGAWERDRCGMARMENIKSWNL